MIAPAVREAAVSWISSADSKATAIASVLAVVIGLVSMDVMSRAREAGVAVLWLYFSFLAASGLSVALCLWVLWPQTNRAKFLPVNTRLPTSPTYFGDVPKDFEYFARRAVSEEDLMRDKVEQAFVIARIAQVKMWRVRLTILSFGLAMAILIAMVVAAALISPDAPAETMAPASESTLPQSGAASPPLDDYSSPTAPTAPASTGAPPGGALFADEQQPASSTSGAPNSGKDERSP